MKYEMLMITLMIIIKVGASRRAVNHLLSPPREEAFSSIVSLQAAPGLHCGKPSPPSASTQGRGEASYSEVIVQLSALGKKAQRARFG